MLDGRGQVKRRAGLRLWLSGLWLGLLVVFAIGAPGSRRRTLWRRT